MMDWKIRPATVEDVGAITPLWQATDFLHARLLPGVLSGFPMPEIPSPPGQAVLVAFDGSGTFCGYRSLRLTDEIPGMRPTRRATLSALAVSPHARGQGCGRELMKAGEGWAIGQGATEALVTVWADNLPSRSLVLGLGYSPIAETLRKELAP